VLSVNGQITFTNVTHMLNRVGLATILVQEDEVQSLAMTLHPAFILLDFETLGKSTWALIDRLKHHPQTQHLAIVVMAQTNVRAIALTHGISAYLEKPFRSTDIDDLVKNLYNYVRNDVNKQVHSPLPLQTPAHNSTDSLPSFSKLVNNDSTPSGQCAPKESDSSISPSVASSPCPLILLAEDNEANIATLVNYLELQGYRMTIASTGREAITAMGQEQPDLILMDIQMPEMDGLTAIQQIRLMPNGADLPIIALTALAMPDDRQRCFAAGATDYVAKPVKMRQLREMIHTMLFED
jgi:CheY-like chemotaxis protein